MVIGDEPFSPHVKQTAPIAGTDGERRRRRISLPRPLFRTVTGDVAFLLAVGACLVLILGSGLLLGLLELG